MPFGSCPEAAVLWQVVNMDRLDSLTLRQLQSFVRAAGVTGASQPASDDVPAAPVPWPHLVASAGAGEPNCLGIGSLMAAGVGSEGQTTCAACER